MSIKHKVVVITGASSGIGAATAKLLARKGAKLVLGARRESNLQQLVAEIEAAHGQAIYAVTDVAQPADSARLVQLAKETFGQVDVLFLNAGLMPNSNLSELKTAEWNQMVDVNLKGVLHGIAAVLPTFIAQKSGQIITTSSVAGLKAYPGGAVYGATKWAVRDLMETFRMESALEGNNIRTATIYPAAINTELLATITSEKAAAGMTSIYQQYGIPADRVANVVAFAIDQPEDTNINEFTIGPTAQPW